MPLSLAEFQVANELAGFVYDFLPGKPHPYADAAISFEGVARRLGLSHLWMRGSKKPAIATLLQDTLETQRGKFCDLILAIVKAGLTYRASKHNPITREDIKSLNQILRRLEFMIPELWDPSFLDSLPGSHQPPATDSQSKPQVDLAPILASLLRLDSVAPQERGYAFERFLTTLFAAFSLTPRATFRLVGEQIDGSFDLDGDVYLVEAKWHSELIGHADLLVFKGKVEGKATWSRGLFVSYSGFTPEGLEAFGRGRSTNIVGISGQDLFFILEGRVSLQKAIHLKTRRAAETGAFFVALYELLLDCGAGA